MKAKRNGFIASLIPSVVLYIWFRGLKSDRLHGLLAIVPAWLIHGLYDFGLSNEVLALGDWTAFISMSLAIAEVIVLIGFILFIRKAINDEKYTAPLLTTAETGAGAVTGKMYHSADA